MYSAAGDLTGYMVAGDHGFVDLATGANAGLLSALEDCYVELAARATSPECRSLLEGQGVQPDR